MPNTLCHIGIQGTLGSTLLHPRDLLWVIIGCILPDLPWILLKVAIPLQVVNPYDLRLYCTAQASLFFCFFLSAALATLTTHSFRIFTIIFFNSALHLFLDSLQIKWGNGVHLLFPLQLEMFHLDLLWPEHFTTLILSILGFLYLIYNWRKIAYSGFSLSFRNREKTLLGLLFVAIYLVTPIAVVDMLETADVYHIKTMRSYDDRPGKIVAFDRPHYFASKQQIRIWSGEYITIVGPQPDISGRVSFKGEFLTGNSISVSEYHFHKDRRDLASQVGLIMSCTLFLQSLVLSKFHAQKYKKDTLHAQ